MRRLDITFLSFTMTLPGPLSQREHYKLLCGTQTGRDLLFMSTIDLLFSFFYLWLEAGGYFSLNNFNILLLWQNWYCAFFHSFSKQMLALDKIFMTESSTVFVHMQCYNQQKMKVLGGALTTYSLNQSHKRHHVCPVVSTGGADKVSSVATTVH